MPRQPIVAGQFYSSDFQELDEELSDCFTHEFGPGDRPSGRNGSLNAVISPHAGYTFSGPCAAWSFKAVGEGDFPEVYLMLGLNHRGMESAFSKEDWLTPIGLVKNDSALAEELSKATGIPINEDTHRMEHSIEVQLPFLQFVSRDRLQDIRIVPLMIGRLIDFSTLAQKINTVLEGKKVVVITSSDFTHLGASYGYAPFQDNIKDNMYALDKKAIKFIADLDSVGFLDYIEDTGATICGKYPIALTIELMKEKKVEMEMYYTSGDILGDYSNAVGYASVLFR